MIIRNQNILTENNSHWSETNKRNSVIYIGD